MNKEELIESTKNINEINRDVENKIAKESDNVCLICKKKVTSFCNSHSIPYSVFNHMNLENGEIIPHYNAAREKILTKVEKGKRNSGIFKLICKECDQKYFFELDNFDIINGKWNNELLRLQAQRINLYQIYRLKENSYQLYRLFEGKISSSRIKEDKKYVNKTIDYYKKLFKKNNSDEKENYEILYDEILDFETNFTTASILPMLFNPCLDFIVGKDKADTLKFESHQIDENNFFTIVNLDKLHNDIMYVVVLPYDGKTRVTLFCDNNSICNFVVRNDFDFISNDNKLLYISASIIINGRNIYGNKRFMEEYRKACNIFNQQFNRKYTGGEIPEQSTSDIKEQFLYIYDNGINLFKI